MQAYYKSTYKEELQKKERRGKDLDKEHGTKIGESITTCFDQWNNLTILRTQVNSIWHL